MQDITEHALLDTLDTSPQFKLKVVGRINHDVSGAPYIAILGQLKKSKGSTTVKDKCRL